MNKIPIWLSANLNSGISHHLPPKKADRQAINRKRSAMTAFGWKIPKSLQELEIPDELKTLLDGTDFMLYDSGRQQWLRFYTNNIPIPTCKIIWAYILLF